MSTVDVLAASWVVLFCGGGWMIHALLMMWTTRAVPMMARLDAPAPEVWPRVTVIVPACNEGDTLEEALTSLLAQDYPNLQIILIDDRSTDATGDIVDRMAATDDRVTPLHITELPDGWLGKVHALHNGVQRAEGAWLLFTDADVHYVPGTLRRVIAWAEAEGKDFVTALPHIQANGFWLQVGVMALGELMGVAARIWEIGRPGSDAFAGVGPFNLLRRSVFDRSEGLEWLKMEVSEDVGVGLAMQRAGARMAILNARDQLLWRWYPSLGHMVGGLEKNTFALIGQFKYHLAGAMVVLLGLTALAPLAALLTDVTWVWVVACVAVALHIVYAVVFSRWLGCSVAAGLAIPLGKFIVAYVLARSAWLCHRRGGVIWRGTTYGVDELKAGHRVVR